MMQTTTMTMTRKLFQPVGYKLCALSPLLIDSVACGWVATSS